MHHAVPSVARISSRAPSARLFRVTTSKEKRSASDSTCDRRPISRRTALTRRAPCRRAVSSTICSTLAAKAISCMAHLDFRRDAWIERLHQQHGAVLQIRFAFRQRRLESSSERAAGVEVPFGRRDDAIGLDAFTVQRDVMDEQAARVFDPAETAARPERQAAKSRLRCFGQEGCELAQPCREACECGATKSLQVGYECVLAKASERTGLGRLTVPLWRTGKVLVMADCGAYIPQQGITTRARHQRHLAGTETRLRAANGDEQSRRGSVASTQPPIESMQILCEESSGGRAEHMSFHERAGGCRNFIASRIECAPNVSQRARIRWLTKRVRPIDKGAPAVLLDHLHRDHARVHKKLVGRRLHSLRGRASESGSDGLRASADR